ncbi:PKD domain-containing protein [Microbacterium sp. NPDC055665]
MTNDEGRPLTITDVAQFAPAPATTVGEPGNVGIAGMPANFVAAASVHTRAGTLFDRPTSVRFTPVRFSFTYGDGGTTTTNTGGRSWAALGQAQFTPTPTSHSYRERGTYSAHVTVHYTAEVDIGGGWFPIDGELSIDGPARQIRVYEAETALVARTCAEQPGAPGC